MRARPVEIATALAFAALGGLAMFDSARIGFGWGFDGPQSGTFPYWVGGPAHARLRRRARQAPS
ncbi:MAG: hypothetical protein RML45_13460 [Acetobacteraceae bacterium]|nr:hypothetical protein [Acetobacteraceae bacterium]